MSEVDEYGYKEIFISPAKLSKRIPSARDLHRAREANWIMQGRILSLQKEINKLCEVAANNNVMIRKIIDVLNNQNMEINRLRSMLPTNE